MKIKDQEALLTAVRNFLNANDDAILRGTRKNKEARAQALLNLGQVFERIELDRKA